MLEEDQAHRESFNRDVADQFKNNPLRRIAIALDIWSAAHQPQGSYGKNCAIYSNEINKAADALEAAQAENKQLRETLEWYEERVREAANPERSDTYSQAVAHEILIDGGKRARKALNENDGGEDG